MNRTVPSPTNWPEDPRKRKLLAKKSGLRVIDEGTKRDGVEGLIRQVREFRHDGDKLDGYVAAYCVRRADGSIYWKMQSRGNQRLPEQIALARGLSAWLEGDS